MIFQNFTEYKENFQDLKPRILGLDWGARKIGIAINDSKNIVSSPLTIIENNDVCFDTICKIVVENNVKCIVIGMPLDENGERSRNCDKVELFANELDKKIAIDIVYFDERMTTRGFGSMILSAGEFGRSSFRGARDGRSKISVFRDSGSGKRKEKVSLARHDYKNDDAGSAAQILESFTSAVKI